MPPSTPRAIRTCRQSQPTTARYVSLGAIGQRPTPLADRIYLAIHTPWARYRDLALQARAQDPFPPAFAGPRAPLTFATAAAMLTTSDCCFSAMRLPLFRLQPDARVGLNVPRPIVLQQQINDRATTAQRAPAYHEQRSFYPPCLPWASACIMDFRGSRASARRSFPCSTPHAPRTAARDPRQDGYR